MYQYRIGVLQWTYIKSYWTQKKKNQLSTIRKIIQMMCVSIHNCQKSRLTDPKWPICRYVQILLSFLFLPLCFLMGPVNSATIESDKTLDEFCQLSCSFFSIVIIQGIMKVEQDGFFFFYWEATSSIQREFLHFE